ncbi:MAG TPA: Imm1 family immunity protein [Gemmatimonadales bacterium]|nr:Imm1 family immunity protein [Gemmatimonadales bacterium]
MSVAQLTIPRWRDGNVVNEIVAHPTWEQVEAAIRQLDNEAFNDLYLLPDANDSETYLCVGGGGGRYVLAGVLAGDRFPTLIDPNRPAEPTQLIRVGGQEGDYPANVVHDLNTTLQAVHAFWASGSFNGAGLHWEEL